MIQKNKKILFGILLIALYIANINCINSQENPPIYPNTNCGVTQTSDHSNNQSSSGGGSNNGGGGPIPRIFTPKLSTLYDVRDKCLKNSVKGRRYIEEYYYFSDVKKDFWQFSLEDMGNVIDIMPSIYEAYDNFINPKFSGVILSENFAKDLISVLKSYKPLSEDSRYNSIIDKLIIDVNSVTNMNKSQVIEFMNED